MKYPLKVVERRGNPRPYAVVDAAHKVVCEVSDGEWDSEFARFIVCKANGARRRKFFRSYTRADWEWERNCGG